MAKIGIMGGGSWGIALAALLWKNGHEITVWSALAPEVAMLKEKREHKMLPGVKLDESITFTAEDQEAVAGKDLLVMSVASSYVRETAHRLKGLVAQGQKIVNVAKGIEESTLMTLSQIIEEEIPQADVAVMSGPSHAEEVGRGVPTTIVVGAASKDTAEYIQTLFMNEVFRVYVSPDILGMELGGSLKNVVALAAGSSVEKMEAQIREFRPMKACMWSEEAAADLRARVADLDVEVLAGMEGLLEIAVLPESQVLVTAIVGMIGIRPTIHPGGKGHRPGQQGDSGHGRAYHHAPGPAVRRGHPACGQRAQRHLPVPERRGGGQERAAGRTV